MPELTLEQAIEAAKKWYDLAQKPASQFDVLTTLVTTIEQMAPVVVVSEAWRHGYIDDDELVATVDTYRQQRGKGE